MVSGVVVGVRSRQVGAGFKQISVQVSVAGLRAMHPIALIGCMFIAMLLCLVLTAQPARAATFPVTNMGVSGAGSLRQAVINANASPGPDTITFAIPANSTIFVVPELLITDALTINASGSVNVRLDATGAGRIMNTSASLTVISVTLQNAYSGLAAYGGGIFASQGLTLTDVVVTNTHADNNGGGVYANGPLVITGGGFFNDRTGSNGGGAATAGAAAISGTTFISNTANSLSLIHI